MKPGFLLTTLLFSSGVAFAAANAKGTAGGPMYIATFNCKKTPAPKPEQHKTIGGQLEDRELIKSTSAKGEVTYTPDNKKGAKTCRYYPAAVECDVTFVIQNAADLASNQAVTDKPMQNGKTVQHLMVQGIHCPPELCDDINACAAHHDELPPGVELKENGTIGPIEQKKGTTAK